MEDQEAEILKRLELLEDRTYRCNEILLTDPSSFSLREANTLHEDWAGIIAETQGTGEVARRRKALQAELYTMIVWAGVRGTGMVPVIAEIISGNAARQTRLLMDDLIRINQVHSHLPLTVNKTQVRQMLKMLGGDFTDPQAPGHVAWHWTKGTGPFSGDKKEKDKFWETYRP
jgi:hypothetical protein